jgi:pilus assembly protein Flp/PilA
VLSKFIVNLQTRRDLYKAEEGQGLVEYGLIIALVGLAVVGALGLFADDIGTMLGNAGDAITGATGGS